MRDRLIKRQMQPQLQYKPGFMTEQQLIGLARSQGGLFSDHEFQPGQKALGKHEDGVVWLRPPQIANAPQLFIDGSSEGDVVQGLRPARSLQRCWLMFHRRARRLLVSGRIGGGGDAHGPHQAAAHLDPPRARFLSVPLLQGSQLGSVWC